jgi:hypothetical protein
MIKPLYVSMKKSSIDNHTSLLGLFIRDGIKSFDIIDASSQCFKHFFLSLLKSPNKLEYLHMANFSNHISCLK